MPLVQHLRPSSVSSATREAMTRGPHLGRRDRAEPLARPTREDASHKGVAMRPRRCGSMSTISTWSRCHRHWATVIAVVALLVGSLTLPIARPVAASDVFSLSGTVHGPSGPLENIQVNENAGNIGVAGTQTASDGTYSLTVPAGSYTVSFHDNSATYVLSL